MSPDLCTCPQTQIPTETSKTENEEANATPPFFELGYKPLLVFVIICLVLSHIGFFGAWDLEILGVYGVLLFGDRAIILIFLRLGKTSLLLLPAFLGTEDPWPGSGQPQSLLLCLILLETQKFKLHQFSPYAKKVIDIQKYHYLFIFLCNG